MANEKFCLRWNDFEQNISVAFRELRDDKDFFDVTLACDDEQIEAHKVILASSSPFFWNLLKRNQHPRPLIYMRGIKSEDLLAIVDFLYCGEANVFQENLDSFLAIAEELKLKGLMGQMEDAEKEINPIPQQMNPKPFYKREKSSLNTEPIEPNLRPKKDAKQPSAQMDIERRMAIPNLVSGDLQELDLKVKSMMETSQNLIPSGERKAKICKVCGKEGAGIAIRDHIEANHLEGVTLPCNACDKTFRSRTTLRRHKCSVLQ